MTNETIELGKTYPRMDTLIKNADKTSITKAKNHYFIYLSDPYQVIKYKVHEDNLTESQIKKLENKINHDKNSNKSI